MYKIEIWRYKVIIDTFESESLKDIYNWFNDEGYKFEYENGGNAFYVYEDDKILDGYELEEFYN